MTKHPKRARRIDRSHREFGFAVNARVGDAVLGGAASLSVSRGRLELRPGFLLAQATSVESIVQTSPTVRAFRPRIPPLGLAPTVIVVSDGRLTGTAFVQVFSRWRVQRALAQCGFSIQLRRTLFDRGDAVVGGGWADRPFDEGMH